MDIAAHKATVQPESSEKFDPQLTPARKYHTVQTLYYGPVTYALTAH